MDEGEDLPEVATLELHGLSFLVIHILGKPSKREFVLPKHRLPDNLQALCYVFCG